MVCSGIGWDEGTGGDVGGQTRSIPMDETSKPREPGRVSICRLPLPSDST